MSAFLGLEWENDDVEVSLSEPLHEALAPDSEDIPLASDTNLAGTPCNRHLGHHDPRCVLCVQHYIKLDTQRSFSQMDSDMFA